MRKHKDSRFNRWWQEVEKWSVTFFLLLPITGPIWICKVVLVGVLVGTVIFVTCSAPSALRLVANSYRDAIAFGQTDDDSTRLKGGEARQKGSERKGALIRPGGSLNSDDLRRRLYELRERKPQGKANLTRNVGGQYGEQ